MKKKLVAVKVVGILSAAIIGVTSSWAQSESAPVVGSAIVAVNVDVVSASGYRASKLLGSHIYNDQGDKIGKLDDFIVASDAEVSVAIVAVGGFLGMGARMVAVPAVLFESNDQGHTVLPGATKDVLEGLPEFRYVNE